MTKSREQDLALIAEALEQARVILEQFTPGQVDYRTKSRGDPVTEADLAVDRLLRKILPRDDDGWLSEETEDDPSRLAKRRIWVVDPIDGTREFVKGVPDWGVSIGLVEDGQAVAGGILIPQADRLIIGALELGVTLNGEPCTTRQSSSLDGAEILASRGEFARGEWDRFKTAPYRIKPTGSAANKLGLIAVGLADATWTMIPKHEWDVAAGTALIVAAGGAVRTPDGHPLQFNQPNPRLDGLIAVSHGLIPRLDQLLDVAHGRTASP
jgi:myo-inositol-1(or 4)-monophosphatase